MATPRYVVSFGMGHSAVSLTKEILGGKGKGLVDMAALDLPVPPGFIITTEACIHYRKEHRQFPSGLLEEVSGALSLLEAAMGAELGSDTRPLLVSVRSGARVSMPGMMDTVLNLGLNDHTAPAFSRAVNNEHLAYDSYCRFIQMYADIVEKLPEREFLAVMEGARHQQGVDYDFELPVTVLKGCCARLLEVYHLQTGRPFPQDTRLQLQKAIGAVFNSWDSARATVYRKTNHIPDDWGTAVIVQAMVFGNRNDRSATGVGFTRDPATGEALFYGEYLMQAQGEEVVAGRRTPHPINEQQKQRIGSDLPSLERLMPQAYCELLSCVQKLEAHYRDMQDIEFTIDDGKLYMLQTRTGKRTGVAAVRIAMEMLEAGLVNEVQALQRIDAEALIHLLAPVFDSKAKKQAADRCVAKGLNAGPGAASGRIALSMTRALEYQRKGLSCLLVREETSPDDYPGMVVAQGILTARGGSTSHAAVVARGMGKPCVVGCSGLWIDEGQKTVSAGHLTLHEGDEIAIDGNTGEVFFCALPTSPSLIIRAVLMKDPDALRSSLYLHYKQVMALADKYRRIGVRANADTPQDTATALSFGAEGVGLCRTEHMFMEEERLLDVRRMLFSLKPKEREEAVTRLLPHQKNDFKAIFQELNGRPVTIRLLDPPLHEFLPATEEGLKQLAKAMNTSLEELRSIYDTLKEANPMLGLRGCRLGIMRPELTEMQTRAILEAALEIQKEGIEVRLEIMIPLVGTRNEFVHQHSVVELMAKTVFREVGVALPYKVGTMIELPRAALMADEIAEEAEFFSFGTNDLTQSTFGISRDDGAKFVPSYVEGFPNPLDPDETLHILKEDPFQTIDQEGVGQLMVMALQRGRRARHDLKCGICGEHGGDPHSVKYCHRIGIDYVSCSPYRVPVARLAAAQAALEA